MNHPPSTTRREFLKQTGVLAGGLTPAFTRPASAAATGGRLKVAAVYTAFFYRSHAHVILENFVAPYLFNGEWIAPDAKVVSIYADQFPADDLGRLFAKTYGIPIYPTIAGALCRGGDKLAVDAVLSIGEHGDYPFNEKGQHECPRKRFFDEIVAVFRAAGLWSPALACAALDAEPNSGRPPARELIRPPGAGAKGPPFVKHGILLSYRSGLRAIVLAAESGGAKWHFACRLAGEEKPLATSFYGGPWDNRNLFKALSHAIQTHFREGRAPYPVERTLLTTGIVAAEMESRFRGGKPIDTPHLAITYPPRDYRNMREMGASWKILTEDIPEPKGIEIWKPA